jgi:hypothetical protein
VRSGAWTAVSGRWTVRSSAWLVGGMGIGYRPRDVTLGGVGKRAPVARTAWWVAASLGPGWCAQSVSGAGMSLDLKGGVCGVDAGTEYAVVGRV